ncbi:helix-turn-helix domain-containing protein [Ralstonia insidiosa]|jgi:Ner family transcriptional regulator|uniref:Uncharacterized protein n=1 Tax=Ralstonia insidiosa TaxID=190721 RepID=A0A191ZZN2_9RALS|nr:MULTISPECIES: helix-turn-helix transcriptional regulator [Ralstonia]ANJ73517.1 hypothetical protein A9Y76_14040 [Ralstonia insidiosa]KAB0473896.1 transcriptional regulator [Ralstonia insidiosa]MBY4912156.1 helix-turn-helix domain-containing protein [Ralstonia insidiosa]
MSKKQAAGWHREDIKAAIRKKGSTMNDLARENGLPPSTVRNALTRPAYSGELAIMHFLNVPGHELWPERWTPEGRRIRPRYAQKYSGTAHFDTVKAAA